YYGLTRYAFLQLSQDAGDTLSYFFFFSSRRRHTRSKRDWSSDVCSSDLMTLRIMMAARHLRAVRTIQPNRRKINHHLIKGNSYRSEERRVGKECRCRESTWHEKKKVQNKNEVK